MSQFTSGTMFRLSRTLGSIRRAFAFVIELTSTTVRGGRRENDCFLCRTHAGILVRIFRGLFRVIEHSWQMCPLGLLFALGFDTATEVGLLGLAATQAAKGMSV